MANTPVKPAPVERRDLVGTWRVIGCETSPMDPADCARGTITFSRDHIVVDVPAASIKHFPYSIKSSEPLVLDVDGETTPITFDTDGTAHWRAPGFDGRVGRLSLQR
ncbi:MAG: hypothetical protein QM831_08235 [Kofleriaceae bacterium]